MMLQNLKMYFLILNYMGKIHVKIYLYGQYEKLDNRCLLYYAG